MFSIGQPEFITFCQILEYSHCMSTAVRAFFSKDVRLEIIENEYMQYLHPLPLPSPYHCHALPTLRATAKMKLLLSVFSCLYSRVEIFAIAANNTRRPLSTFM